MTAVTESAPFGLYERMLAGRYLRAKRKHGGVALISIISFIGIMLAVGVLIVVMSVMNGFRAELLKTILGVNSHAVVLARSLTPEEVAQQTAALRGVDGVETVTAVIQGEVLATANGVSTGARVVGIAPDEFAAMREVSATISPQSALATFGQGRNGGDDIIVGAGLARQMGLFQGADMTLIAPTGSITALGTSPRRKTYQVSGAFAIGNTQFDNFYIYMPKAQAELFFSRRDETDRIEVWFDDPDRLDQRVATIRDALPDDAVIRDWRQEQGPIFNALQVERNVMRLILMMIVLIAAMNIISGLVMLVKNKGRDIAILRTMGASQGAILRVFIMAGAAVGLLGTIVGLVVGVLFCLFIEPIQNFVETAFGLVVFDANVYFLSSLPAKIEWGEVAIVAGWGFLMSCIATLPPAIRASRLDPVEALRYE